MTVRLHAAAQEEFLQVALYYTERGRSLGEEFTVRVEQAIASIRRFPRSRPSLNALGERRVLLRQFPYALVYIIKTDAANRKVVVVYAVAHTKRDPNYWRGRLTDEAQGNG